MAHSIAAKYAARPAARFPSPPARARERRLGLRPGAMFRASDSRPTVLRDPLPSAFVRVRSGARSMTATRPPAAASGLPASASRVTWAASSARRARAHPAPWRA